MRGRAAVINDPIRLPTLVAASSQPNSALSPNLGMSASLPRRSSVSMRPSRRERAGHVGQEAELEPRHPVSPYRVAHRCGDAAPTRALHGVDARSAHHLEVTHLVAMCNYRANRLACDAADRAMQTCGGVGYSRHMPFEHIYRHHRRYRITEGSEEIQMRKVGQNLFGFGRK